MIILICSTRADGSLDAIGWKYYIVYIVWIAFEFGFLFRYIVETRGKTLEETAALFDGERPQHDLAQRGGEAAIMNMGRANVSRKDSPATDLLEMRPISASNDTVDELSISILDHVEDGKDRLHYVNRGPSPYFF